MPRSKPKPPPEPSHIATARYQARVDRGLTTVHSTLDEAELAALDRVRVALGLPEHGGRHVRGGRAEAIRQLILAADKKSTGDPRKAP